MITNIVQNSLEKLSNERIEKIMIVKENKWKTYEKYQKLRKFYGMRKTPV